MFGDIGKMMKQVNEMKSKMKDVEKELNSMVLKAISSATLTSSATSVLITLLVLKKSKTNVPLFFRLEKTDCKVRILSALLSK